jgi:hypothetical protein
LVLALHLRLVLASSNVSFVDAARPPTLENLDEELEHCLRRVSFMLPLYFCAAVLVLIGRLFSQALVLLEDQCKRRAVESARTAKSAELEVLVKSQAEKIARLEKACDDLKREKENVTAGYRRLLEKHKTFTKKVEQEKTNLVEAHVAKVAKIQEELNKETRNYTDYRRNMHRHLRKLHEVVAPSFEEVKARCLPILARGTKVEEMIDWVAREVRTVPDTVWQLNDNFVVLAIEGILNMLSNEGCQELGHLRELAASQDTSVLQDVLDEVWRLVGLIVRRWSKPQGSFEALRGLEIAIAAIVSGIDN